MANAFRFRWSGARTGRNTRPGAALRLRRLWRRVAGSLRRHPLQPDRSRLSLRHRPCARRHGKGPRWYEDGKLEHKANTFGDFIACARHLCALGLTRRKDRRGGRQRRRHADGRGRQSRARPFRRDHRRSSLCRRAQHDMRRDPAADAAGMARMGQSDRATEAFRPIRSYSPYDNVRAQAYPPMLIEAGLTDPRVTYWEPAKWAQALRDAHDRRRTDPAEDQHGGRPRRRRGAFRRTGRRGLALCFRDRGGQVHRLVASTQTHVTAFRAARQVTAFHEGRCRILRPRLTSSVPRYWRNDTPHAAFPPRSTRPRTSCNAPHGPPNGRSLRAWATGFHAGSPLVNF